MESPEKEVRCALQEVLDLYDIKLDEPATEIQEEERFGDYSEIISKTQDQLDDLSEKAEEIYQRIGMNKEELESYASNPNNFTKEQWEALERVRAACETYKRAAITQVTGPPSAEKKPSPKRKRKEKQRFAKKKNWIPL